MSPARAPLVADIIIHPVPLRPFSQALPVLVLVLVLVLVAVSVPGCAELGLPVPGGIGTALTPPKVTFTGATLVSAPSSRTLAAHYCPDYVSVPFGGAALLCEQLFGPRPP